MALHIFTKAIIEDKEFSVYNFGDMSRDFTYVGDIVESIKRLILLAPKVNNPDFNAENPKPSISSAPFRIFNIGNNSPVALLDFVHAVEEALGKKGKMKLEPIQAGDVPRTYADVQSLFDHINFKPSTDIKDGVKAFVDTYLEIYSKN